MLYTHIILWPQRHYNSVDECVDGCEGITTVWMSVGDHDSKSVFWTKIYFRNTINQDKSFILTTSYNAS